MVTPGTGASVGPHSVIRCQEVIPTKQEQEVTISGGDAQPAPTEQQCDASLQAQSMRYIEKYRSSVGELGTSVRMAAPHCTKRILNQMSLMMETPDFQIGAALLVRPPGRIRFDPFVYFKPRSSYPGTSPQEATGSIVVRRLPSTTAPVRTETMNIGKPTIVQVKSAVASFNKGTKKEIPVERAGLQEGQRIVKKAKLTMFEP